MYRLSAGWVLAGILGAAPVAVAQSGLSLEDLSFMTGCWEGAFERNGATGTIEEHYTTPSANVMLGTTRYLLRGEAIQFELTVIRKEIGGIALTPYPRGRKSEDSFYLRRIVERTAYFENPEHDFPKRIIYRLAPDGALHARVDAGEGTGGSEWRMMPAECLR
jgi:hypothetical protein